MGNNGKRSAEKNLRQLKGLWYLRISVPGRGQVEIATRTKDKALAREMLEAVRGRIAVLRLLSFLRTDLGIPALARTDGAPNVSWARDRWARMNPRERLAAVFALQGGRCSYCGCEVVIPLHRDLKKQPNRAVMDHKNPLAAGGSDGYDNAALSCHSCNAAKCDRDPESFAADILMRAIRKP